jgi:hypothetical protein
MKKLLLISALVFMVLTVTCGTTSKHISKSKSKLIPKNLNVRYYLTDMNHNPTVHFMVGESYYVYLSIQNITDEAIPYKKNSFSKPLFHFIALKSADTDYNPRFNNQNESLQIPISTDIDTLLTYHAIIDDYQQIQFFAPGFYTIQLMPNVMFPEKYKKDWGTLKFEIECHPNPNIVEIDPLQDILKNSEIAPLLEKLKDLPELQNPNDAQ